MTAQTQTQTPPPPPIPRTAQAVLFLDILGNPHAEMPGTNGSRRKIDLPVDFADRNPELMAILLTEKLRLADQTRAATSRRVVPERSDPQRIREARIEAARVEHARQWQEYLVGLTEAERERQIALRDAKLAKAHEAELARARQVYLSVATDHSVELANRVIPDPSRRPRRKISIGVYAVSPRNEAEMAAALSGKKPKAKRQYDKAKVIPITL